MATNKIQDGEVAVYTNSGEAAIASGDVVVIGSRVGIALGDIAVDDDGSVAVVGVYNVPKTASLNIVQGTPLYWDATAGKATTASSGNTLMGYAFAAAGVNVTTINAKLNA